MTTPSYPITESERLAYEDVQTIEEIVAAEFKHPRAGRILIVDGTQYSPSWRALSGGSRLHDLITEAETTGDVAGAYVEIYEDVLDRATDRIGLWWDDGCLWGGSDEEDEDPDQEARDEAANDGQMWDNLPEATKEAYRKIAAREEDVKPCPRCGEMNPAGLVTSPTDEPIPCEDCEANNPSLLGIPRDSLSAFGKAHQDLERAYAEIRRLYDRLG